MIYGSKKQKRKLDLDIKGEQKMAKLTQDQIMQIASTNYTECETIITILLVSLWGPKTTSHIIINVCLVLKRGRKKKEKE